MKLNLFDLIIIAIFSGSTLLGLYQGFILSLINIVSFLATIFLTIILIPLSKEIIIEYLSNEILVTILSTVTSYLISSFSCNWLATKIKEATQGNFQGLIDRLCGSWLGALRGLALCLALFMLVIILATGSYVGAKDLWIIISTPSAKDYPNWLKKSATIDITQNSYLFFEKVIENTWLEETLKNIKLPAKDSPKISTEEILKQAKEIKEELEQKPAPSVKSEESPRSSESPVFQPPSGKSLLNEIEKLLEPN